jgi:hypothetical protein
LLNILATGILSNMLDAAMDKYNDIDNDYDEKFKYYETAIRDIVAYNLDECLKWVVGPCDPYFTCVWIERGRELVRGRCNTMGKDDTVLRESWTIQYILEYKDGFNRMLGKKYGIDPPWIRFGASLICVRGRVQNMAKTRSFILASPWH